ncbi:hypothetical protein PTSG_13154 [Salpingoeca rosetta]|uniref:Uncharacterized protein n=1 Tax=Salpingoeca rosetta (strain ATCC 50818 / BSB-021) TaxID=946362 RepID=F2USR9_SALR5|nr:uncharacterized protein PTSG_13154 [Salpingoeca rosetta]EGD81178.1 hypothetical protein PTSG_13154 [Salpingoeca rosetta]|eukprot:XP_004987863.1 hypothetical protein PTSG_13154 [Salpingoeca rosetta]
MSRKLNTPAVLTCHASPLSPSSPSTAQPPSHPADTSLNLAVEEAHEAVEPTTMTMTSDGAADAAMDVEGVLRVDVPLPRVTTTMMVGDTRTHKCEREEGTRRMCAGFPNRISFLISQPIAFALCHHHHRPFPCDVARLTRDRDSRQHRHTRRQACKLVLLLVLL